MLETDTLVPTGYSPTPLSARSTFMVPFFLVSSTFIKFDVAAVPEVHVTPRIQSKRPGEDATMYCHVAGEPFPKVSVSCLFHPNLDPPIGETRLLGTKKAFFREANHVSDTF